MRPTYTLSAFAALAWMTAGYEPPAYSYRSANCRSPKPVTPKRKRKFKGSKAAKKASRRTHP